MIMCPGCYKTGKEGYCTSCRKLLFDGARVSHKLSIEAPPSENIPQYQEKIKRLSIPGAQLKYSLQLKGKELQLAEKGGQYILKPIPPTQIVDPGEVPENEHLTMQIASQVFGIRTAANALIYFKDGTPAYITRRFDIQSKGNKYLQEDMAQISGRTRQGQGELFKYEGTYEEIGHYIRKYVAAFPPALENFFRILVFNYLFSNGDAHLKNFSLIQSDMGDYTLTPAYDMMCTLLHIPDESNTALQLYDVDTDNPFYSTYGFYGRSEFMILAQKIGILPGRAERFLNTMLSATDKVIVMITHSFLQDATKERYIQAYQDRSARLKMTE